MSDTQLIRITEQSQIIADLRREIALLRDLNDGKYTLIVSAPNVMLDIRDGIIRVSPAPQALEGDDDE